MATDSATSATPTTATVAASAPAWGIAWGGGMLVLLGLWLRAKFEDLSLALVGLVIAAGAAVIVFAVWQLIQQMRQPPTLESAARRRAEAGLVCMIGGLASMALAATLAFLLGLAGFGEYVGLALFGLTGLFVGSSLRCTAPADPSALWTKIRAKVGAIKAALVVGGAGMAITFFTLAWSLKPEGTWWPEYLALLAGGIACLMSAFWLQLQTAAGEISLVRLRIFTLILGGVTGLIITIMILGRMYVWRNEVFLGGLEVWLGDGFWRFWLCAYVLLAGLALMFGSLLLARADIHQSVVLRRSLYGYNTVFNGLMLLATLILANIFFYVIFPYTFTWSRTSFSTLSASSRSVLANLKQPTTIFVLLGEGHPAMNDLKALMDNVRVENARLVKVNYLSPDLEPRKYLDLAAQFKELAPERGFGGLMAKRGVLLVYGEVPDDPKKPVPPHTFVAESKIFEDTGGGMHGKGKSVRVFKAEGEIFKELHHLSAGKQTRKLYFLQGNGELDVNNNDEGDRLTYHEPLSLGGCAKLAARLKKDDFEVVGLKFDGLKAENVVIPEPAGADKRRDVPDDAYAVVIPGPSEPMSKETLDALERYVDKGGRLLVFFETMFDAKYTRLKTSGLEEFLKKYGVDVRPEFAMMFPTRNSGTRDPRELVALPPVKAETELAKRMDPAVFFTARVIKTLPAAGPYKAEPLLQLDSKRGFLYWAESDPRAIGFTDAFIRDQLRNQEQLQARFLREPLPIAVTVTQGSADLARPRMVIFGDTDCILNDERHLRVTYDMVASSLEWMAEKGGYVGPRPREQASYNIPIGVDGLRLFIYPGLLMLLAIAGLGVGLWLVRRR